MERATWVRLHDELLREDTLEIARWAVQERASRVSVKVKALSALKEAGRRRLARRLRSSRGAGVRGESD